MVECHSCRSFFRAFPETIGARCPKCKAPLFERPERRQPVSDAMFCAQHAATPAAAVCARCRKPVCVVCRTRWHGKLTCVDCAEQSLSRAEPNPRELKKQGGRAVWSLVLAVSAWTITLMCGIRLCFGSLDQSMTFAATMALLSSSLGLSALGQGCPVLLARGPRFRLAAAALVAAASQLGLLLGLVLINVWHN
ncbi:MAG: hypothetical protein NZO58_02255 [Gemmataceae bacterium]|nr:hypothetical protein [Gemmataceae bacterium]